MLVVEDEEPSCRRLVLVDVDLPSLSGLEVCREIRSRSSVPIVVVSPKTPDIDPVLVLESGADYVVATPIRVRELVARLRAILRRSPLHSAHEDVPDMAIEVGDLRGQLVTRPAPGADVPLGVGVAWAE